MKFTVLLTALASLSAADVCSTVTERQNTDGNICNAAGSLTKPSTLGRATTISGVNLQTASTTCRNYCLDNGNCKSFSFNPRTRSCQLFVRNSAYQGFKAGRTGTVFTDRLCYIQNFLTAPGFENPSFDQDAGAKFLQPWKRLAGSQQGLPTRAAPGYNSPYAAKLSAGTSIGSQNSTITQSFSLCPNVTYYIYPYYKYLGQGNTSTAITVSVSEVNGGAGSTCYQSNYPYIAPGQNLTDAWSPFPYDGNSGDPCYFNGIEDPSCQGLEIQLRGHAYTSALQMQITVYYQNFDPDATPPSLDEWLFDMVVKKVASSPLKDPHDNTCDTAQFIGYNRTSEF